MAGLFFFALALLSCSNPWFLLLCLSIHELGHIICGLLLGYPLPRLTLCPGGLRLIYKKAQSKKKEIALSLSGSAAGILLYFIPLLPFTLRAYSLALALINLLPISSLDGGGALRGAFELFLLPDRAFFIAEAISDIFCALLCLFCIAIQLKWGINPSLLCVSVYITVTTLAKDKNY